METIFDISIDYELEITESELKECPLLITNMNRDLGS